MASLRRTPWSLVLWLAPTLGAQATPEAVAGLPDAPALFVRACATCHGLDGSGTGPSVLDRPARNFKEGGFSFGNTVEAIERTLAHGIPGSPMPAFETTLTEAERRALAAYVLTLGPPIKEVSEAETLLVVRDRPLVVRGILPPLTEGGPKIPRGLLIGTPDGLTFEYDLQDVRLVAVRSGEFVRRSDWGGRGGTPLDPLGKVVWSENSPESPWLATRSDYSGHMTRRAVAVGPMAARLRSTEVDGSVVSIAYELWWDSEPLAVVVEQTRSATAHNLSGFARRYIVQAIRPDRLAEGLASVVFLTVSPAHWDDWDVHPGLSAKSKQAISESPRLWAHADDGGLVQVLQVSSMAGSEHIAARASEDGLTVEVPLWSSPAAFEVGVFLAPALTRSLEAELDAANE